MSAGTCVASLLCPVMPCHSLSRIQKGHGISEQNTNAMLMPAYLQSPPPTCNDHQQMPAQEVPHPTSMPSEQSISPLGMVSPSLSIAMPPANVPKTPVKTVTAPNTRSAVSPLMENTSRPAFGPRYASAPM